jgi:hypothetical protein
MSKRYVFWRGPDGSASNKLEHAPIAVLKKCGLQITLTPENGVQWALTGPVPRGMVVIRNMAVVVDSDGHEINEHDAWDIVRGGIVDVVRESGGKKPLDPDRVLHFADARAAELLRRPLKSYILLSSLSVKTFPVSRMKVGECDILPIRSRRGFVLPSNPNLRKGSQFFDRVLASKYQLVSVTVVGRTTYEAYFNAMNALDVLRGIWTVFVDYRPNPFSLLSVRSPKPGIVHNGPLQTLHHLDGTSALDNSYWYDPAYYEDYELFELREGWGKVD